MTEGSYGAYWGLAENPIHSVEDRLGCALKAIQMADEQIRELERPKILDLHLTTEYESNADWQGLIRQIVFDWIYEGLGAKKMHPTFSINEVYVVWWTFLLGGWKAMVSTTLPDGRYYEITYDKNKGLAYLDTYRKTHNNIVTITKEN